jgi:mRNA interferase MazF
VAARVNRGEIWLYSFDSPDKRRPVLVLSRQRAIDLLRTVIVAPITSSVRGAPSEVPLGLDEGLKHPSVVTLDHVQTVEQRKLHSFVGTVGAAKMAAVCAGLSIATGCG